MTIRIVDLRPARPGTATAANTLPAVPLGQDFKGGQVDFSGKGAMGPELQLQTDSARYSLRLRDLDVGTRETGVEVAQAPTGPGQTQTWRPLLPAERVSLRHALIEGPRSGWAPATGFHRDTLPFLEALKGR